MTLKTLISNNDFNFNAGFKVTTYNFETGKETILCDKGCDPSAYYQWEIVAINQDEDGTVCIECDRFAI